MLHLERTRHGGQARRRLSTAGPWFSGVLGLAVAASCAETVPSRRLPQETPALHRAAALGDLAPLRARLEGDVDRRGLNGWTALHYAAVYDAPASARLLLAHRAEVDALDERGMTPLHWAARRGSHRVVELLLQHKADVMARNRFDMTPLHEARTVAVVERLLAAGAELEARDVDGMTPLHTAATKVVAQFLIAKGANLNARARDGRTPMDMPPVPVPRVGP